MASNAALVVVLGQTATGKSELGLRLAEALDGEIICADSRTIYKGMDIGTAKPSAADRARVRHHLLDVVEPDADFSVADFKRLANNSIEDISGRGKIPIMVGGSGLYIDAVLFDYAFSPSGAPRDPVNPRHLSKTEPRQVQKLRKNTLIIGLSIPNEVLTQRIAKRVEKMVGEGFVEEVMALLAKYPGSRALSAPGYKAFAEHIAGHLSLEEAKALFIQNDTKLAKRQLTWFKRNKSIHWLKHPSEAKKLVQAFLNKSS